VFFFYSLAGQDGAAVLEAQSWRCGMLAEKKKKRNVACVCFKKTKFYFPADRSWKSIFPHHEVLLHEWAPFRFRWRGARASPRTVGSEPPNPRLPHCRSSFLVGLSFRSSNKVDLTICLTQHLTRHVSALGGRNRATTHRRPNGACLETRARARPACLL